MVPRRSGLQDYKTDTIANADDVADADGVAVLSFAQAQEVARGMRARATRIAAGLPVETGPYTVKQCIAEYLAWMEQNRKGAKDGDEPKHRVDREDVGPGGEGMTMSNERLLNETCLAIARDMLSIVSNLVMEHERRDAFTEFYEAARQRLSVCENPKLAFYNGL